MEQPMPRSRRLAFAVLISCAFGCTEETERFPPDPGWEPSYFDSIDERARGCGLRPLRRSVRAASASEIRIWAGFELQAFPIGGHPLEGMVLERLGDRFSGTHYPRAPETRTVTPASGWARFWQKLEAAGVFELPDSSELKGYNNGFRDGIAYVVELRRNGAYRAYKYGNPAQQDLPEAKRFVRLLELLRKETGFDARG
jgi:hypothetical protein